MTPPHPASQAPAEGALTHLSLITRAEFVKAVKLYPSKRPYLVADVATLLGREITPHMFDKWCSESAQGYQPPPDVMTAVCLIVGTIAPFAPLLDPLGGVAILVHGHSPKPEDLRQDLSRIVQRIGKVAEELEEDLRDDELQPDEAARYEAKLSALIAEAVAAREHVRRHA